MWCIITFLSFPKEERETGGREAPSFLIPSSSPPGRWTAGRLVFVSGFPLPSFSPNIVFLLVSISFPFSSDPSLVDNAPVTKTFVFASGFLTVLLGLQGRSLKLGLSYQVLPFSSDLIFASSLLYEWLFCWWKFHLYIRVDRSGKLDSQFRYC